MGDLVVLAGSGVMRWHGVVMLGLVMLCMRIVLMRLGRSRMV